MIVLELFVKPLWKNEEAILSHKCSKVSWYSLNWACCYRLYDTQQLKRIRRINGQKKNNVESTISEDAVPDVISYTNSWDSLNFLTSTQEECDAGPSLSTKCSQHFDENNMKVNYSNQ